MFTNRMQGDVAGNRAVVKRKTRVTALAVLLFGWLTIGFSATTMAGKAPKRKAAIDSGLSGTPTPEEPGFYHVRLVP